MVIWHAVNTGLLDKAFENYIRYVVQRGPFISRAELAKEFRAYVGITESQYADFEDSWGLYVHRRAVKKLIALADTPQHHVMLFKAIDIKYENRLWKFLKKIWRRSCAR